MNTRASAARMFEGFARRFRDKTTRRILSVIRFGHHNRFWALKIVDQ